MKKCKHLRYYFISIPSFPEDSYLWSCSALWRCICGFFFVCDSMQIKVVVNQWIYIVLFISYWKVLSGNFEQRLPFLLQTHYKCIINMIMYSRWLPCKIEHFTHMPVWLLFLKLWLHGGQETGSAVAFAGFSADFMLQFFGGRHFQTVLTHPMWLGQASRANLLDVLSVTLGGGVAAGGMLAQRTCCEESHL